MKPISITRVITFVLTFFLSFTTKAQNFGTYASAVWVSDCNQSNYFNTSGSGASLIGPVANVFDNNNFGTHTQNSGTLILRGGQVKTFKVVGVANVCSVRLHYRVYLQSATPGSFNTVDLPLSENCNGGTGLFPSGGSCSAGDQKWDRVIADGTTSPYAPVNLTAFAPGNYVLEVYYDVSGSSSSTTLCDETVTLNNSGNNYKAYFSIQSPVLSSTNPTTCNGSQGSITISGLTAGASYSVIYSDDGVSMGPLTLVANGSGQITINGLNAGIYSDFEIAINGCTTQLNTGIILSNPVYTPTFSPIPPFCAGSTPPVLPTTSNNGITGTWNPSVVNNMASGSYTFTPNSGQCGIAVTKNIVVNPNITPAFSFGTSLTICSGNAVPSLPNTSTNGISGTWSPSVVSNTSSGSYTFTPNSGQCATTTTFTVTVNPNVTPAFSFGTSLTICAGGSVPALPTTSDNGITGTWSPSVVSNTSSGSYTFTPSSGQCATTTTFNVTVNPNVVPTFSFGNSITICAGGSVPGLPGTSDNGVNGTWSPSTADNQNSGTYTFTPTAGLCATTFTLNVTVNPNITPNFSFGTSLTICAGGSVPALPSPSTNGITGTWSPAVVDNMTSGTYTFTPDAGQCATTASFTVTVNPNITPTFSFGTSLTICAGGTVPALPGTSSNGISGTWSPATVDNQNSGVYTFTPTAGQCATTATFTVTVNPNITPTFSFGSSLTICAGAPVPTLPNTSDNGITGTWTPATVDNQNSGTYTFTPTAGQCSPPVTFLVTVNPNIVPGFSFGTSMNICEGGTVPALTNTSDNGITGTWSPAAVDNMASGSYTFTPDPGQCATTTLTVTVNPNVTPTFSFGTSMTICAGAGVPSLPTTSDNGITGTWSPSIPSDQISGTYTFTPAAGQCATTTTFTITVTPNTVPTFSFGTSMVICAGGSVPLLPSTSDNGIAGTWSPAVVDNQTSAIYTFTPTPVPGQCLATTRFVLTVNPIVTPTFSFGNALNICTGGTAPALPTTSSNGITGTWSPATISNQNSGTYTFTPDAGQCVTGSATLTVTVAPVAGISSILSDTTVNDGAMISVKIISGTPAGVGFSWTNSNPSIGLTSSGTGNVPSFTATNTGNVPITAIITVTPMINGCPGVPVTYRVTVNPLNKDVFVPNVFSPNGDGKNDLLLVYGNYISKIDLRIFNQWGEQVQRITDKTKGWDGHHQGRPQPVGVYVYTLEAVMTDGRIIQLKGNITLLR